MRLIGPKPRWARADGGEAGLHPSNIHDNAYAVGTIDFTGDMPIILGPDGPSLGGFVCPATIVEAELWKIGQLKARRHACASCRSSLTEARAARCDAGARDRRRCAPTPASRAAPSPTGASSPILAASAATPATARRSSIRQDGDANLLVEYGPIGARPRAALPRARADAGARGARAARRSST